MDACLSIDTMKCSVFSIKKKKTHWFNKRCQQNQMLKWREIHSYITKFWAPFMDIKLTLFHNFESSKIAKFTHINYVCQSITLTFQTVIHQKSIFSFSNQLLEKLGKYGGSGGYLLSFSTLTCCISSFIWWWTLWKIWNGTIPMKKGRELWRKTFNFTFQS